MTARADGDLTPEGIIQKVADSSGSQYSSGPSSAAAPPPPVANKPAFTPTRSGGIGQGQPAPQRRTIPEQRNVDDDGWGPDAPPVTRTQLEKVQPAYQPTRVNMQAFMPEQSPAADTKPDRDDVVKGGYQPVGKVDIAAIRRQARESGELGDDRPAPVKGAYEPVGKVDIAAIRSRAQPPPSDAAPANVPPSPQRTDEPAPPPTQTISFSPAERLTSLPKPKVSNKFGGGPAFGGTKPPLPAESTPNKVPAAAQIGSASRTFADEGGKTPQQQWAEKKARERGMGGAAPSPTYPRPEQPTPIQPTGTGEWKSSYTGKHWAPVQTTHTGKSLHSDSSHQAADATAHEQPEPEAEPPQQNISAIRDQFSQQPPQQALPSEQKPPQVPNLNRPVPVPGLSEGPTEPEPGYEPETQQPVPSPPPQPRSPTPPTPAAREASPIRVAMPVGRGVEDAHDEQHSPPAAMPAGSMQQAVPDEQNLQDDTDADMARATAQATISDTAGKGGIRAIAQYDYEKAEENEVELREGEYVSEIEMIDKDWWVGVNTSGERGLFPSNYVELVENEESAPEPMAHEAHVPEPAAPASPQGPSAASGGPSAKALYDYEAGEENEISFPENAKITNIVSWRPFPIRLREHRERHTDCPRRNSRTMTGGSASTTARKGFSRPTMCSSRSDCRMVASSLVVDWAINCR